MAFASPASSSHNYGSIERIATELHASGWALFHGPDTMLDDVGNELGSRLVRQQVKINPRDDTTDKFIVSDRPIPLHNDHPSVPYVALQCAENPSREGVFCLLDMWPLVRDLDPQLRARLQHVRIEYPRSELDHAGWTDVAPAGGTHPVVWHESGRDCVHWIPWRVPLGASESDRSILQAFLERIRIEARLRIIKIPLFEGDGIVFDQRRFLHGRTAVNPGCHRVMKRLWILP